MAKENSMEGRKRKIGEKIQPLGELDEVIAALNQKEDYHILYGYTFDRKIKSLIKAEDNSYLWY